jgi:hypothetical protein
MKGSHIVFDVITMLMNNKLKRELIRRHFILLLLSVSYRSSDSGNVTSIILDKRPLRIFHIPGLLALPIGFYSDGRSYFSKLFETENR